MVTPRKYATDTQTPYRTVMHWISRGLIAGVEKKTTDIGFYYLIPSDAPKPDIKPGPKPKTADKPKG